MDFELRTSRVGPTLVVQAFGEIDMATAGQLEELVTMAGPSCREVVIDLTSVTFLDSAGMRAVARLIRDGKSVVLKNATGAVLKALTIGGMDRLIPVT